MDTPLVVKSHKQISDELREAVNWFKSYGFNCDVTRIGKYQKDVDALVEMAGAGRLQSLIDKRNDHNLVNSLGEATDIINIYQGLKAFNDESIIQRLRKIIKGPFSHFEENERNSSAQARDFAFELAIASRMANANYKIDLGSDADLIVIDGSKMFFIECKRPKSSHAVEKRIRDAYRQLKERYNQANSDQVPLGIIALSISKITNPKQEQFYVEDELALQNELAAKCIEFTEKFSYLWQRKTDSRFIGVLLYFKTPATLINHNLHVFCDQFLADRTFLNGHHLIAMAMKLAKSVTYLK